jgi:8-oxo-dGTP pyrophosphatase MutT (NUDIX family)
MSRISVARICAHVFASNRRQDPSVSDFARKAGARRRQVAAIPVRRSADGKLEVLLVTSRGSRRWLIPKGWPWSNCSDWQAAAEEAREEGGVIGIVDRDALGSYSSRKGRSDGSAIAITVTVYRLDVTEVMAVWPEKAERSRGWFSIEAAAAAVTEPGLKAILLALAPPASTTRQAEAQPSA